MEQHCDSVGTPVALQPEGLGVDPLKGWSVLHILHMFALVYFECSGFLPRSKRRQSGELVNL